MRLLLLLTHLLVAAANAKNSYTRIDDTDMSDFTPGEGPSWLARVSGALEHDILDGELPDGQSFVEDLDGEAAFDDFIEANRPTMVLFYAPYCGHCKALMPAFEKAAWVLDDHDIQLARVDATVERTVARKLEITGFPTLKLYPSDPSLPPVNHFGSKDAQSLIDTLRLAADPTYESDAPMDMGWTGTDGNVLHAVVKTWSDVRQTFPKVLAMFYAPWCKFSKNLMSIWAKASTYLLDNTTALVAVNCMRQDAEPLCRRYVISGFPEIMYFSSSTDLGSKPDRVPLTQLGVNRFLLSSNVTAMDWVPTDAEVGDFTPASAWEDDGKVVHLDDDHFSWYRRKHDQMITLFHTGKHGGNRSRLYQEYVVDASRRGPSDFAFSAVDCDSENETCSKANLKGFPTLRYFANIGDENEIGPDGKEIFGMDADGLISFAYTKVDEMVRREAKAANAAAAAAQNRDERQTAIDFSTMKIKTLKKLLRERGQECTGCTERAEFESMVQDTIHLPKLKKSSGRKRGKKALKFDGPEAAQQAFYAAVRSGTVEEVEDLLAYEGVDVDNWDAHDNNNRALHIIAGRNDTGITTKEILTIAQALLDAGPMLDAENSRDATALHVAVLNMHLDISSMLIKAGAKVDAQNYWGVTPLHYAANRGVKAAVQMLLDAGADPFLTNTAGKTPLDFATDRSLTDVISVLQAAMDERVEGLILEL